MAANIMFRQAQSMPFYPTTFPPAYIEKQLDVALEVADVIEGVLDQIVEYTPKDGSLATKKSALVTMAKIFETTCLSDDELDALIDDEWLDKFGEVVDLAVDLGILDELQECLNISEGNDDAGVDMDEDDDGSNDYNDCDDHDDCDNCENHRDYYSDDYGNTTSGDEDDHDKY
ncbi:hypothetical protein PspLS_03589 [Pyricularia sp. CBS 133598]|nr:hypothetical protein PspLS_03589 [Pyricularia sp. CBS 133598]